MDSERARARALGAYRGPLIDAALPLLTSAVLLFTGLYGRDGWAVAFGVFLFVIAVIPATVVRPAGILLLYRFRRIPWTDVAAIQEIDLPRSKECLRVRRTDDRIFVLRGIPADRLAGLMELTRAARRDATGQRP